jgi:DNA-directed RNA polymerase alpha subunit
VKVGQVLQLQDDDLLRMRNFGKKSLDEMKERLRMRGFFPPEDTATDYAESAGVDFDEDDSDDDDGEG